MTPRTLITGVALPVLLVAGWAGAAQAEPGAMGRPKMLVHGNYCGPGNNAPLPPVDALDAACARHDACTPNRGLPSKACNRQLEREATAVALDRRQSDELRAMAGAVATFAAANPSTGSPDVVPGEVAATAAYLILSTVR